MGLRGIMMKKILIYTDNFYPLQGGAEINLERIIERLIEDGYSPDVLTLFPEFSGDIGLAKYCGCTGDCGCIRWNCGSIFTKPSAIDIWELFYNFVEANKDNEKFIST